MRPFISGFCFLICLGLQIVFLAGCGGENAGSLINNPATANNAEGQNPTESAILQFKERDYNFGTITSGDTVRHSFSFINAGKSPLIISKASASCGCTVPSYPKEPIAPGQEGVIEVVFNSANKLGKQQKTVTVTANTNPSNTDLTLSGEINHPKEADPVN
jgi:hypothetical protein